MSFTPDIDEQPIAFAGERGLARSAGVLSLGNAASRVLGLVREMVIAYYFGASGQVSAFRVAAQVPTLLYDFLIGGMLSAALVPVLSDYARTRSRREFMGLVGVLLGVFTAVLALIVILLEIAAPQIAYLLAGGLDAFDPTLLPLTTRLIRIVAPAVWLFSLAGLITAVLYALERFTFPAIATAVYNLGIVIAAPLLADRLGVTSLAIGIVAGSAAQVSLMAWDMRRAGVEVRLSFNFRHPALRRILLLYLPIAAGLVVSLFQIGLDRRLASSTGAQSIAWMANATTLQQLPLGLISVAIALASLPRLSQHFAAGDEGAYRRTLGRGLRMVLFLIVPAAVGLWLLGEPVTRLLFQRGSFTAADTEAVVAALNIYVIGMVFAAVDFPLNFAFYARNNTLLPALVGVASVGIYMVVAFALLERLGYLGLVWADSAKQAGHAGIMLLLLYWRVGPLDAGLIRALGQIGLGAACMALLIGLLNRWLVPALPVSGLGTLLQIAVAGGAGLLAYGLVTYLTGLPESVEAVQQWRDRRLRRGD
jgi:putative peptidoglycan lipid II flippase